MAFRSVRVLMVVMGCNAIVHNRTIMPETRSKGPMNWIQKFLAVFNRKDAELSLLEKLLSETNSLATTLPELNTRILTTSTMCNIYKEQEQNNGETIILNFDDLGKQRETIVKEIYQVGRLFDEMTDKIYTIRNGTPPTKVRKTNTDVEVTLEVYETVSKEFKDFIQHLNSNEKSNPEVLLSKEGWMFQKGKLDILKLRLTQVDKLIKLQTANNAKISEQQDIEKLLEDCDINKKEFKTQFNDLKKQITQIKDDNNARKPEDYKRIFIKTLTTFKKNNCLNSDKTQRSSICFLEPDLKTFIEIQAKYREQKDSTKLTPMNKFLIDAQISVPMFSKGLDILDKLDYLQKETNNVEDTFKAWK